MRAWNCLRVNGIIPIVIFWLVMCGSNFMIIILSFTKSGGRQTTYFLSLLRGRSHQMSLDEATGKSDSYLLPKNQRSNSYFVLGSGNLLYSIINKKI